MNRKKLLLLAAFSLLLTGCSPSGDAPAKDAAAPDGPVQLGDTVSIDAMEDFRLSDQKDVLSADGLYYATWVTGSPVPYENSDGDTVDLYDAQIYCLVCEASGGSKAQESCDEWLATAREHYEILTEDTVVCADQPYTFLTYNCISEDNPNSRGASAFAARGASAVCVELTCVEDYEEDPGELLKSFLDGCHYERNQDVIVQEVS